MKKGLVVRTFRLLHENAWDDTFRQISGIMTTQEVPSFERLLHLLDIADVYWKPRVGLRTTVQLSIFSKCGKDVILWTRERGFSQGINPKAPLNAELARFYMQHVTRNVLQVHRILLRVLYEN